MSTQKKRGRPFSDNPKNERMAFRVTHEEKQNIQKAMRESGLTVCELLEIGIEAFRRQQERSNSEKGQP